MILGILIQVALAQDAPDAPSLNLQRWSLPLDSRGTTWTWDAADAPKGWTTAGVAVGWQHAPVVYRFDDGTETEVIGSAFQTSLLGAWSAGRVLVGAELPTLLGVQGDTIDAPAALGDVSVAVKGVVLDHDSPVGLAALGRLWLPTTAGAGASWASDGPSYELSLLASLELGPGLVALNLGTHGQPTADFGDFVLDDALTARLGASLPLAGPVSVAGDLVAELPWTSSWGDVRSAPAEGLLSLSARLQDRWMLSLGGGRGLTAGVGAPDARVIAALRLAPERSWDRDHDGVLDAADACPDAPEDRDGYRDADGCADPLTEVFVRLVDEAGAPLPEVALKVGGHSGAGSLRVELAPGTWPAHAEAAGFVAVDEALVIADGPPVERVLTLRAIPVGTLEIHVLDPNQAVIADATWSVRGAAMPPLVDGVGVADLPVGRTEVVASAPGYVSARFPVEIGPGVRLPLTVTLRPARVALTREKLVIADRIFFDTNRATIKAESLPLLDEIVSVLQEHPDIQSVRIEGHTDSRGSNQTNLVLSDQRAASVRDYLVQRGIQPDRLRSIGYGETRPLVDREDAAAWDKNRRVEFFIERWQE